MGLALESGFGAIALDGQLYLAIPVALLAGLVSFASPCVLPLVPGYLAYIGGFTDGRSTAARGDRRGRNRLLLGVLLFVVGFAAVFVVAGFLIGSVGFWLDHYRDLVTRIAGVVVIAMGLVFVGQVASLQRTVKVAWRPRAGLIGAPLLGVIFAVGWSPCLGPTLVAIQSMSISSGSAGRGAFLALCYALGLGIPFLIVALGLGWATRAVTFLRRHIRAINLAGGGLLIVIGILMVTGVWSAWLLQLQAVIPTFVPAV